MNIVDIIIMRYGDGIWWKGKSARFIAARSQLASGREMLTLPLRWAYWLKKKFQPPARYYFPFSKISPALRRHGQISSPIGETSPCWTLVWCRLLQPCGRIHEMAWRIVFQRKNVPHFVLKLLELVLILYQLDYIFFPTYTNNKSTM